MLKHRLLIVSETFNNACSLQGLLQAPTTFPVLEKESVPWVIVFTAQTLQVQVLSGVEINNRLKRYVSRRHSGKVKRKKGKAQGAATFTDDEEESTEYSAEEENGTPGNGNGNGGNNNEVPPSVVQQEVSNGNGGTTGTYHFFVFVFFGTGGAVIKEVTRSRQQ